MSSNRIRSLSGFRRAPQSWLATDSTVSTELQIPPGYTALSLRHLTTDEQRHIQDQAQLYQWAFEQSRREVDRQLFGDWSI